MTHVISAAEFTVKQESAPNLTVSPVNLLRLRQHLAQHFWRSRSEVAASAAPRPGVTVVRRGDTLSGISQHSYGQAACWPGIYRRNTRVIGGDPNLIVPGQQLTVPTSCSSVPVHVPQPAAPAAHSNSTDTAHVSAVAHRRGGHPVGGSGSGSGISPGGLSGHLSFGQLEVLWVTAGGPAWAEWSAATIAECESSGEEYAYNPSGASGYWQILGQVVFTGRSIFDPMTNALNAVAKFRASGDTFAQWVCQA
jgi:LysM repeat protein